MIRRSQDQRQHANSDGNSRPPRPDGLHEDRGVAVITAALTLTFLMGISALAVDGSNVYRERGEVQNAADLAATAAAYKSCIGFTDAEAIAAAESQAAANGYDPDKSGVVVTVTKEEPNWRVTIDTPVDVFFAPILGFDDLTTLATALASCELRTIGLPGIFAGGSCGTKTFEMSGQDDVINGTVHSNDDMKLNGSNLLYGDTTYVGNLAQSGTNQNFTSGPDQTSWQNWPLTHDNLGGLQLGDFAPGGSVEAEVGSDYYYALSFDLDSSTPDGVYVARDHISVPDELDGAFTLIVLDADGGFIEISGSGSEMTAFYSDILIVSNAFLGGSDYPYRESVANPPECDYEAITLSGSNATYEGLVFAPRGMISLAGQYITVNGGLIGYAIKYNGSNLTINAGTCCGDASPITVLVE